jgi:outer membrane protein TolC
LLICAWVAGAATLTGAERPEIPARLTLEQAVAVAFGRNPALRRADARATGSAAERDRLRAPLLPQVSISAFDALQTVNLRARGIQAPAIPGVGSLLPVRVGPFSQVDARALVTQEVFNLPLRYQHRAGNARVESAEAERVNAREALALQVVATYVEAQQRQAMEGTLRKQLSLARQLYTITTDRFQQGIASSLEVKRALQQANNLQQSLLEAENGLTAAKLQLANVMHAKISSAFEIADMTGFYDTRIMSEQEALTAALQARPDYQAAQAQVRAADLELRAARSRRLPTLSFAADYGQSGRAPFQNLNTYRIQGSLNIPLYLGGAISAETRQQQSRAEEAQAFLEEVEAQVETEVLTALSGVASARRQVEVAEETIRLAGEELDLSTARFTSGVSDNTEVVNAQDRLARAEENRIRALFNLNLNRANLQRASGMAEKTYRP